MVCDFFAALYTADIDTPRNFENPIPYAEFPATRMCGVLHSMNPYKSPNPDGFHAIFYQRNWGVVGSNIWSRLDDGFANAFMVLLHKVDNPSQPEHLRPISLLNVAFKLVTKTIVNRLKPVLPLIVSPSQDAFIHGRKIIDNIVIIQEELHSINASSSNRWMILKVDLAKTYDRVKWNFFRSILTHAGNLLSIPISDDFGSYLGIPTAIDRMPRVECLLDKISNRLRGWKARSLSLAGRVTMANSVLSSIPLYYMQTNYLPMSVYHQGICLGFYLGTLPSPSPFLGKKIVPKKEGGLGLRLMRQLNSASLAKLGWRTLQEPSALWSRIIHNKYCNGTCNTPKFTRKYYRQ
ncbi:hypothetical protein V2J09_016062 [Rumex salicifolius]